jgi:hypothetical protein
MNQQNKSILWLTAAILFAAVTTMMMLTYMVTNPSNTIIDIGGDCGKNYFVYLYHALYDHGVWFDGMNYPYGENVIYVDGQPFLSTLINVFNCNSIHQALAVMNLVLSFNFALAIIFTYKLLVQFKVQPLVAILFSAIIIIMFPQTLRFRAHFGLSYVCLVPMLFYWTLSFHTTRSWKPPIYIFILSVFTSFMHLYLGGIVFIWVGLYLLGYMIFIKKPFWEKVKTLLPMAVMVVSLFLFIKLCVFLTDPLTDRPLTPFTAPDYSTFFNDIYTSPYSPFWRHMHDSFGFNNMSIAGEGLSYLGIISILVFIIALIIGVSNRLKKRPTDSYIVSEQNFSAVWLFIAFGAIVLAMNPLSSIPYLPGYLQLFKQFRSTGRFSWIFYYVISIYTVVVIYSWYIKSISQRKTLLGYALLIVPLLVWAEEAKGYAQFTRKYLEIGKGVAADFFDSKHGQWPQFLAANHYNHDSFQAIILLPYFISGSDKLWIGESPSSTMMVGMKACLQLGMPMVDALMTRSSWSVAEKQAKTVAGPYADKPMLRDLKDNRPFLLILCDEGEINQDERYLTQASDSVGRFSGSTVYACYPDRLRNNDKQCADSIAAILPSVHTGDTCIKNSGQWRIDHMDVNIGSSHMFGTGGMVAVTQESKLISTLQLQPTRDSQLYEFSCWFLLSDKDYRSPMVQLDMLDSAGKNISTVYLNTKFSTDNEGFWFRAFKYFHVPVMCRSVACTVLNIPNPSYLAMDELMLRPADAVIISKDKNGKVMVNNHVFSLHR